MLIVPPAHHFGEERGNTLIDDRRIHHLTIGSYAPCLSTSGISAAVRADLPEAARLMADSSLLQRYRVDYHDALASLEEALEGGDLVLVHHGKHINGIAWLSFAPRVLNGAAYLRLLLTATPGQGIGAALLFACQEAARPHARHLYLLTTSDNTGARRFYERHGYRHVGDLPGLVVPWLDESLYHKPLRATVR